MAHAADNHYYVPDAARWPLVGSIGLTLLLGGFAAFLNGSSHGADLMWAGFAVMVVMLFGWFGTVVLSPSAAYTNPGRTNHSASAWPGLYFPK